MISPAVPPTHPSDHADLGGGRVFNILRRVIFACKPCKTNYLEREKHINNKARPQNEEKQRLKLRRCRCDLSDQATRDLAGQFTIILKYLCRGMSKGFCGRKTDVEDKT